jgi:uncharacterized protein YjgD (DUF1641 family)
MIGMANETRQVPTMLDEAQGTQKESPAFNEAALNDLVELINLLASARDAMTDDMVTRIARTTSEGVALLDHLIRNEGVTRLLEVLNRSETQYLLMSLAEALGKMSRELASAPPARGGIGGIWRLAREPGTQEGLRAVSMLGKYWNEALRDLHRRGG